MKLMDYLESDREKLTEELRRADTKEQAQRTLETEFDRLLYRYNESCENDRVRTAAAHLLSTAKTEAALLDTDGEPSVWTRKTGERKVRKKGTFFLAVVLLVLGILGAVLAAVESTALAGNLLDNAYTLLGLAATAFFFGYAGYLLHGSSKTEEETERIIRVPADPDAVWRRLTAVVLDIDRSLGEIESGDAWEKRRSLESRQDTELSAAEIDLFADLLEAAYARDGDFALERLNGVKYYLHQAKIETVDYSEKTAALFDRIPSSQSGTIRPALTSGGRVLKKGLAGGGV